MPYENLARLIEALDQAGELHRVRTPVSSMLEISEIADRVSKSACATQSEHAPAFDPHHHDQGGKALLFERVRTPEGEAGFPLLINAFGSYRRMEMALGCEAGGFEALAHRVGELIKPEPPTGMMEKVRKGLELAKVAQLPPKLRSGPGPCQEVVKTGDEVNLFELPVIKCWPDDGDPRTCGYDISPEQAGTAEGGGRYITLGGVVTIHPDDAGKPQGEPRPTRNLGMYRAQLIDRNHTAMHWHMHHDGARHWRAWREKQKNRKTEKQQTNRHGPPGSAASAAVSEDFQKAHEAKPPNEQIAQSPDHQTTQSPNDGMPAAIVLGGESVLAYSATAPLPPGVSELLFGGFLNGKSIPLVQCKTIDMQVPANAEMVIEGIVSTEADPPGLTSSEIRQEHFKLENDEVFEGPFGDHTGFYSLPDRYPLFTVTAITHKRDAVYPTTIVGKPPQEDYYMGKATERLFLPLLKTLVPDIIDYDLPMFGAFHNCAFIKIRKEYPLQARRVMHAIWGAGQMAWTKTIYVVDHDVDVHDHEQVLFHLCANFDPRRDTELVNGPLDILDHAAPRLAGGNKIGFDATRKWAGEQCYGEPVRDWPKIIEMAPEIKDLVSRRWADYGLGSREASADSP